MSADGMVLGIPPLYGILNSFEVLLHALDRQLFVPLLERLEDREVFLMVSRA